MTVRQTMLRPVAWLAGKHASGQVKAFLAAHRRTREVQDRLMAELLSRHADTAFGRDHDFARIRRWEDFKSAVPLGSYETMRPYVQRVLDGETTALLPDGEQLLMFSTTSGTTGQPKLIPVTRGFLSDIQRGWNIFGLIALRDHPDGWLRPILQISSPPCETLSPTGLPCGAISGMLAATQKRIVRRMYVAPEGVSNIQDPPAKYYTMLLSAIRHDVAVITTANPSSIIKLIETGQAHADRLIRDLADGTYTPPGDVPPELKAKLKFRPAVALARRLQTALRRDGQLLPRHFWNPAFLTCWTGGTLKLYLRRLRELFGDVPVRDIGLLASEGRFSVPIADNTPAGLAEITGNLLEFIPVEQRESTNPATLRADELEEGHEYFLVVSNRAALWRYDIDDRVRVVGRFGSSPVFEFLSRGPHTASITGEKITEYQVVEAMRLASQRVGAGIDRFEFQGHFAQTPYYELRLEDNGRANGERIADLMDNALAELNGEYRTKRSSGRLGPVRLLALGSGTLESAENETIRNSGGRSEQYKHKYLLTEVIDDTS